jgi:hypothetical protein
VDEAKVFPQIDLPTAARRFREHLRAAGVLRPKLFEISEVRRPIRVHDLRASFITVAQERGRNEKWVRKRTGHTTSAMLAKYERDDSDRDHCFDAKPITRLPATAPSQHRPDSAVADDSDLTCTHYPNCYANAGNQDHDLRRSGEPFRAVLPVPRSHAGCPGATLALAGVVVSRRKSPHAALTGPRSPTIRHAAGPREARPASGAAPTARAT